MEYVDIQYISDVHLCQRFRIPEITAKSNILVCSGDIGDPYQLIYAKFLAYVSGLFQHVFIIAGNHEFFHHVMSDTHEHLRNLCSHFDNVHYLNYEYMDLRVCLSSGRAAEIRIWGGTMWTDISEDAAKRNNDYKYIQYEPGVKLTPRHTRELHRHGLQCLRDAIEDCSVPCLVLTHHALHRVMNGKYVGNEQESAFVTHVPDVHIAPIVAFVNGHTHQSMRYIDTDTGILFACNAIGYCDEIGVNYTDGLCLRIAC